MFSQIFFQRISNSFCSYQFIINSSFEEIFSTALDCMIQKQKQSAVYIILLSWKYWIQMIHVFKLLWVLYVHHYLWVHCRVLYVLNTYKEEKFYQRLHSRCCRLAWSRPLRWNFIIRFFSKCHILEHWPDS